MRLIATWIVCVCCIAAPARGEVVEVLLPELADSYPLNGPVPTHTAVFQLPRTPEVIYSVAIRVEGASTVGVADCREHGTANVWPMEFVGEMTDTGGELWLAFPPPYYTTGNFESTGEFEPDTGAPTWEFLLDGEGEITFWGGPLRELLLCDPILQPSGLVAEVWLIVNADFALPVEATTWGRVKALYR